MVCRLLSLPIKTSPTAMIPINQPVLDAAFVVSPDFSSTSALRTMASDYSTLNLPDGANLAYEVLGAYHLGRATPIVLVCGMSSVRIDYERLAASLVKTRPGL